MQLKLGCDPEIFLVDASEALRSSIGLIGGSKEHPMPLPLGDGYAVQEDNVAIEFNIPAAPDAVEFINSINSTLAYLTFEVERSHGLHFSRLSAASFPEEQLQTPAARMFGCDPDFSAWTGRRNPRPRAVDANLRSCGGHVHVGYDKNLAAPRSIIKLMDLYLGVPSVLMDTGELRKELYGKAGAFREKSYGVEYRTLSNFWIFEDKLMSWVWGNTERAVKAAVEQFAIDEGDDALIINAINKNDKGLAQQLVQRYNLEVI